MNSRNGFHRSQQWQLAERQRYLTDLEALGEKLRSDVEQLRWEIDEAGGDSRVPTNARLDPLFIRPLIDRREKLLRSIGEIEAQIEEARAGLLNAQQEARLLENGMINRGVKFEDRLTRRTRRSM
jgi:flagellar biosynthesis chaperone FliJ